MGPRGRISPSPSPPRDYVRRDWDTRDRRGRDRDRHRSRSRSRSHSRSSYDDGRTYIPSRSMYAGGRSGHHSGRRSSPPSYRQRDNPRFVRSRKSRSPSPGFRPHMRSRWQRDHEEVVEELRNSQWDHLKLETDGGGQFPDQVQEEDVKVLLKQFDLEKVFKSSQGIFVTFNRDSARRAAYYINANMDLKLAYIKVKATPCAPPTSVKTIWNDEEIVLKAQEILTDELKRALQQDILSKFIGPQLKTMIHHHQNDSAEMGSVSMMDQISARQQGLVGLSFKKQRKEKKPVIEEVVQEVEEPQDEVAEEQRPKKKRKKEVVSSKKRRKQVVEEESEESELESENEDTISPADERRKKRPLEVKSELSEDEEPVKKKSKVEDIKRKKKVVKKKAGKKDFDEDEIDVALSAQDLVKPGIESSLSPSRSLSPAAYRALTTPPPTPPPNPAEGVCDDDEDFYYAKLVLSGRVPFDENPPEPPTEDSVESSKPAIRKHITGSARTEGFYRITHAEKAIYVTQYQTRTTNKAAAAAQEAAEESAPQHITSSRSNRANARRRAQGLEEINQVQRAVALSKGEAANELTFKFNQLQTRKKHLRFARSPIHDWGLYAMERIARGEMVIEYVGEVIRAQVAEKREKTYVRQGIGSSYLFRIDEDLVVDATKKGNLGRLINHSCDPNCTAKIITISGEKKIVIYAKQDIELGDEITYDYHFPFEQDKIPCLCGSAKCRGFLN
ncbi:hypothetical protein GYMLUDRAFT_714774 [Collybiopsis luxurians FD-317 M1]|nr:hypothetical protein GYMLUDRAFT_714774 [Collybiopsis luxurians FD-317 M1]